GIGDEPPGSRGAHDIAAPECVDSEDRCTQDLLKRPAHRALLTATTLSSGFRSTNLFHGSIPAFDGCRSTTIVNSDSGCSILCFSMYRALPAESSTPISIQSASGTSFSSPNSPARSLRAATFSFTSYLPLATGCHVAETARFS